MTTSTVIQKPSKTNAQVDAALAATKAKYSSNGGGSSPSPTYDSGVVSQLNAAREAAVKAGKDANAGNLKDYATFSASLNPTTASSKSNSGGFAATGSPPGGTPSNASYGSTPSYAAGLSAGQGFGGDSVDEPPTPDKVYNEFLSKNQKLVDSIQESYDAQIKANTDSANQEAAKAEQGAAAEASMSGLIGSSAGTVGATKTSMDIGAGLSKENTALMTQRAQAVSQAMQQIQTAAQSAYEFERQQYGTDVATQQSLRTENMTNAKDIIKGLATNHVNFDAFSTDPQYKDSYDHLVQMVGGDPNTLNALWALNTPPANIVKTWTDGSKYYQMIQDPITGKPQVQSFDLPAGTSIPQDWTFQKIGTNSGRWTSPTYNPSDPSTYKDVYVDPISGAVTNGSPQTPSDLSPGTTAGNAVRTVQAALGAEDMSMPLSQAISAYGPDRIAQAMIQNEHGSPEGVQNNPGNIKFANLPGQIDSGKKATDGGTFASYATPEEGVSAISDIIQKAASGQSPAYGVQPTLAGFVAKYTNTPSGESQNKEGSILAETGISTQVFNYLTQGTASMSRMTPAQRNQIMQQATDFLNKNGIDISTFQSQYKTYNDVLSSNISRANKTKIMESELIGTIDNLKNVVSDADLGTINKENVAKVWAGGQVNDPQATQYAFHFQQLKNELAGYFAASQGKASPDVIDNQDAADAVIAGMGTGSLDGLKNSIENSTSKMSGVLQKSVDSAQKDVWTLFGVGDQYKAQSQKGASQVESALTSGGYSYDQAVASVPPGNVGIVRDGKFGWVPTDELHPDDIRI